MGLSGGSERLRYFRHLQCQLRVRRTRQVRVEWIVRDVFVVTHAEATHHLDGLVGGWFDSELTDQGRAQAAAVAACLGEAVLKTATEVYTSDLRRARQTAIPIASQLGVELFETPALREISYGVAGGRPQAWLDERYVPAPDNNRLDHHGGVEGAESRRDVAERVYPFIDLMIRRAAAIQILVTHGFTASIVIAAWMRVPIDSIGFMSFPTAKASITHLREDDFFKNRSLIAFNSVDHLPR